MHLTTIITIAIVLAIGLLFFWATKLEIRGEEKARLKWITELIEAAESGNHEALASVSGDYLRRLAEEFGLDDRYQAIQDRFRDRGIAARHAEEEESLEGCMPLLTKWRNPNEKPELRLEALDTFVTNLLQTKFVDIRRKYLAMLFGVEISDGFYATACESTVRKATDRFRYRRYRYFIHRLSYTAGEDLDDFRSLQFILAAWNVHQNKTELHYPTNWNAWAVRHIESPCFSDFVGQKDYYDLPNGTVSLRMAQAIRNYNVIELAIVLSYCHDSDLCREEVGDVLYAEAVKLYEVLRAQGAHLMVNA